MSVVFARTFKDVTYVFLPAILKSAYESNPLQPQKYQITKWSRVSDSNRRRISPPLYKSGAVATEPTRHKSFLNLANVLLLNPIPQAIKALEITCPLAS